MATDDFFKDYQLLSEAGRGGTGVVYRAKHKQTGKSVAVKVIHEQLLLTADNPREKARFIQNVVLNARMDHPNIVALQDCFIEKGKLVVVSDLLQGDTIDAILSSQIELPVELRLDWLLQLLQGISFAHQAGVMHGGIKPADVFVTVENQVKILDFGLRRELLADEKSTGQGQMTGALAYLAPETYWLNNRVSVMDMGKAGDIFAIGVIAYRLLNGCLPFGLNETMSTTDMVTRLAVNYNAGEPIPRMNTGRNHIPIEVADAVMECLSLAPQKRPATVEWLLAVVMNARKEPLDRKSLTGLALYFKTSPAKLTAAVPETSSPPQKTQNAAAAPEPSPPARRRRRPAVVILWGFFMASVLAAGIVYYRPDLIGLDAFVRQCANKEGIMCFICQKLPSKAHGNDLQQKAQVDACAGANGEACWLLGGQFENGKIGVARDLQKASEYYQKACNVGHAAGCGQLGKLLEQGKGGLSKDDSRAVSLFRKSCNAGYIAACVDLGDMHRLGKGGLPRSDEHAVALYTRACDDGDMTGCVRLGQMHETGKGGLPQNPRTAVTLYEMACGNRNATACMHLGRMHQIGKGVMRDSKKAQSFRQKACDLGRKDACGR